MARTRLAEGWIVGRTHLRRDPDAALLVEHRVVRVCAARPDRLSAPIRRGPRYLRRRRGRSARVAQRDRDAAYRIRLWVQYRHVVRALLEHAVNQTVRVEGRIAPVGRDEV